MKKISYFLRIIFTLFFAISANAQTVEIHVTNGVTGEKKTYEVANNVISIPVNYVKGWEQCTANAIKKYQFDGVETVRGELFCRTEKNTTMGISCVARKKTLEVTIANLYDASFKLVDKDNISTNTYAEIMLICKH